MFEVLPGFRDFYPENCTRRNFIFQRWKDWAKRFDFLEYDIPTLEPLELFTQKSGEEIVGQLFHFEDQGGRAVALRPELTPSLARMVGSRINSLQRPVKWFNIAENFRYERKQKGRLRSHYQFNGDIFGEPGPQADAEIIALVISVLSGFGFKPTDLKLRLSDRTLWSIFLQGLGFEGDRALEVLAVIDKMERLSKEDLVTQLTPFFNDAVDDFLSSVELLRSQRDIEGLQSAMERLAPTAEIKQLAVDRLTQWRDLLASLEALGVSEYLQIDLGIVRGLAYYTGFVFEVFLLDEDGHSTGRALAGGGRYDHLVALLGYPAVPAVGFGMGDVVLGDALAEKGLMPPLVNAPDFQCIIGGPEERQLALEDAAILRSMGYRVSYPLKQVGFGKQFKQAGQSGAAFALIYGSEEREQDRVKIRDLRSGGELDLPRPHLPQHISGVISEGIPEKDQ
ncbi:histidine--tRNA ligase [Puniceicoccales bacterium CK1056]|uniref:Histidine--tRNA ligase n=1 Tax=Oceanipulchritudo coccoides TaxID=2706888 RepID=A0A6B2M058_9BACT|nr:histidine--tRNA ligase [Oceanipulchritudo coccoides]NDV61407.1 histidine--tRNA ligase [Oceanipulchritudo coccoides]